jgi:membrane-bound ClpP family serine protease
MNLIVLLFLLALVFLFFEVFTPGSVFGILGGLTLIGGVTIAFMHYGFTGGLVSAVSAVTAVSVTLYGELVWLPKTRFAQNLAIRATTDATSRSPIRPEEVVGKTAEALTTLAPSGYVLVEGRRYEAYSQCGHVQSGERLRVTGLNNFQLIVTKN